MSTLPSPSEYQEINQVFEDITFSENKIVDQAFADGLQKGNDVGNLRGSRLGFLKGVEFGVEIGYYEGISRTLSTLWSQGSVSLSAKSVIALDKLLSAVESFPSTNCADTDIINRRDQVRSYYKQLCSLLKLDIALNGEELTF